MEKTIKIDNVEYVPKSSIPLSIEAKNKKGLSFVIVRCRLAGIHAGYYDKKRKLKEGVLELHTAIRLWKWCSEFTLSELATSGVSESKKSEVKFSEQVLKIEIPKEDIGEIIFCTKKAEESIKSILPYKNE